MKHIFAILMLLLATLSLSAAKYNGQTLSVCNDYVRSQCGTTNSSNLKEASGLACSRTTPGYLWCNKDEGTQYLYALSPTGTLKTKLTLTGMNTRDDWEDLCTGTYNGTPYIFLGVFGDNDLVHADDYYIVCVPEPAIGSSSKQTSAEVTLIKFGYPDGQAHNMETLMYDPIEQMFYLVDKVKDGVCTLYSLPMSLTYGTTLQRLTTVRPLGLAADKWDFITAGDISPDGSLIAIKNKKVTLLWTRQGTEPLASTFTRQPVQIGTYEEEEQGESIAWLDNYTFYTTSDSKTNTPIYIYQKQQPTAVELVTEQTKAEKFYRNGQIYIRRGEREYTILGK